MGNKVSIKKMNYEDIQEIISKKYDCLLINTLPIYNQECLISNSLRADLEESIINTLLYKNKKKKIIIYGKNCNDLTVYEKYQQLNDLGFQNIYIYSGGLFEWCLLQDIYGTEMFMTTSKINDILKFKPPSLINKNVNNYILTR